MKSVGQRALKLLAVKAGILKKSLSLRPFQPYYVQVHSAEVRVCLSSNDSQSLMARTSKKQLVFSDIYLIISVKRI